VVLLVRAWWEAGARAKSMRENGGVGNEKGRRPRGGRRLM
jgi:hypothetical protein